MEIFKEIDPDKEFKVTKKIPSYTVIKNEKPKIKYKNENVINYAKSYPDDCKKEALKHFVKIGKKIF